MNNYKKEKFIFKIWKNKLIKKFNNKKIKIYLKKMNFKFLLIMKNKDKNKSDNKNWNNISKMKNKNNKKFKINLKNYLNINNK